MKDVILTNSEIIFGGDSLPNIITLFQYNSEWATETDTNIFNRENGTIGNDYFEYSIDCRHHPLSEEDECKEFQRIYNVLKVKKFPTFKRSYFTNNFIILEIPDYGHQAMSPFFTDFLPQVFIYGRKIFDKYVGIIRQYTKKTAYLFIDKGNNLNLTKITNSVPIIVRCVFKENIERAYKEETDDILLVKDNNNIFKSSELADISLLDERIDNYEIVVSNSGKYIPSNLFNKIIDSFKITDKTVENIVNTQTSPDDNNIKDYFKQTFKQEYKSTQDSITRNDNAKGIINLILNDKVIDLSKINKLYLRKRTKLYHSVYGVGNNDIDNAIGTFSYSFNKYDYNIFISNGTQKFRDKTLNIGPAEFEIVPEFTNVHRLILDIETSNEVSIKDILKSYRYFRYPIKNPEILIYDTEGELKDFKNALNTTQTDSNVIKISTNKTLVIYDNNEELNSYDTNEEIKNINIKSHWNEDDYTFFSGEMLHNYFKDTNDNNSYSSVGEIVKISDTSAEITFDAFPKTIILYSGHTNEATNFFNPDNIKYLEVYAFARCFPIKLENFIIDRQTLLFKLPFTNDFLENKSIINSIESTILFNIKDNAFNIEDILSGYSNNEDTHFLGFYNTDEFGNLTDTYETSLSSLNILNFSGRNQVIQPETEDNSESQDETEVTQPA